MDIGAHIKKLYSEKESFAIIWAKPYWLWQRVQVSHFPLATVGILVQSECISKNFPVGLLLASTYKMLRNNNVYQEHV